MALITQDEIISTVSIDEHFSVNNIKSAQILKCELLLSNEFLGETFYNELTTDKNGVGTFTTAKYQTLYDTYLKTLLSEYVLLSMVGQKVLELSNKGLDETGATQLKALTTYKELMQDEVQKSKRLINSYLISDARKSNFSNFLGNNSSSTDSPSTKKRVVFGRLVRNKSGNVI